MALLSSQLLFVCGLTTILADSKWWQTGSPFDRTPSTIPPFRPARSTSPWLSSVKVSSRPCQCVRPDLCSDHYDLRAQWTSGCPIPGNICCDSLKYAEPLAPYYGHNNNLDSNESSYEVNQPTLESIDVGGSGEDSSEESQTKKYHGNASPRPPVGYPQGHATSTTPAFDLDDGFEGTSEPLKEWTCGIATPFLVLDEKLGGIDNNAKFAEFPWTLAILSDQNVLVCGAVLVQPGFAVTAAHCVEGWDEKHLIVRAGEWDLLTDEEKYAHQERRPKKIIIHPQYTKLGLHYDIALIVLDKAFQQAPHIGKICLPEEKEKVTRPCLATGWGMRGKFISPENQSVMKKVEVTLEKSIDCERKLRQTDLSSLFNLSNTSLCASKLHLSEDTNASDGGGPLFCKAANGRNYFVLVGIISWGKHDYPSAPGVYTSARKLRKWIDENIMSMVGE